jgi:hypothetical protein
MADTIDFVVNGMPYQLSRADVITAAKKATPEPIRSHGVLIEGVEYPVKQVFQLATGIDRLDFTSQIARRQLGRLEFALRRSS